MTTGVRKVNTKGRRNPVAAGLPPAPGTGMAMPTKRQRADAENSLGPAAQRLKDAYTFERRLYDSARKGKPSTYKPSSRFNGQPPQGLEDPGSSNVWLKVVGELQDAGIEPAEYVRMVFAELGMRTDPAPAPNQLLAARYREIYREASERTPALLLGELETQQRLARSKMLSAQAVRKCEMLDALHLVLTDPTIALTPIFRVAMALSMTKHKGMKQKMFDRLFRPVVSQYKRRAYIQYARNADAYNEAWGAWLPQKFCDQATRYYDRQLARTSTSR